MDISTLYIMQGQHSHNTSGDLASEGASAGRGQNCRDFPHILLIRPGGTVRFIIDYQIVEINSKADPGEGLRLSLP